MFRKLFVGIDVIRSQEDARILSEAVKSACEDGALKREADEFILVMGARDLTREGYEVVRQALDVVQKHHFKVVAMIPKGFFSVDVLCSLSGADTIVVEDGAKMALSIDPDHACVNDHRDFVRSLSELGDRPFVRCADEIAEFVQGHLVGDSVRVYGTKSIDEEIMERQIACEDYSIFNPETKKMISDHGDLSCLDDLESDDGKFSSMSLSMA